MASDAAATPSHAAAAIANPTSPIRHAAVHPPPLPPAAAAQTPIRRTTAADPSICKLSIQMGKKGGKCVLHVVMGVGCTTYSMYIYINMRYAM